MFSNVYLLVTGAMEQNVEPVMLVYVQKILCEKHLTKFIMYNVFLVLCVESK